MLAVAAELLCDNLVEIGNPLADIDHEENDTGRLDGELYLLLGGFVDLLGGHFDLHADAAGIEQHVVVAHLGGDEVAGDSGHIVDDGHAFTAKPIKETAFPDIRAPDKGDGSGWIDHL